MALETAVEPNSRPWQHLPDLAAFVSSFGGRLG
jgi:hypothetical protein